LFPPVPALRAVMVTSPLLGAFAVAETPEETVCSVVLALMAVAILVATCA